MCLVLSQPAGGTAAGTLGWGDAGGRRIAPAASGGGRPWPMRLGDLSCRLAKRSGLQTASRHATSAAMVNRRSLLLSAGALLPLALSPLARAQAQRPGSAPPLAGPVQNAALPPASGQPSTAQDHADIARIDAYLNG